MLHKDGVKDCRLYWGRALTFFLQIERDFWGRGVVVVNNGIFSGSSTVLFFIYFLGNAVVVNFGRSSEYYAVCPVHHTSVMRWFPFRMNFFVIKQSWEYWHQRLYYVKIKKKFVKNGNKIQASNNLWFQVQHSPLWTNLAWATLRRF